MISFKRLILAGAFYFLSCSYALCQVDSSLQFFVTTKDFVTQTAMYYTPLRVQASSNDYIHFKDAVLTEHYYRNPTALKCWALKKGNSVYINLGYRPLHPTFGFFAKAEVNGRYNIIIVGPKSPEIMEYSTNRKSSATQINPNNRGYIDPNSPLNWLDENNISYTILIADAFDLPSGSESNVPLLIMTTNHLKSLMRENPEFAAKYRDTKIGVNEVVQIVTEVNRKYARYFESQH